MTILSVNNISFNYPGQNYFKGIRQVSLQLNKGQVLAIAGKSGSGKTTLLKCLYGLEDLQGGEVTLDGETVLGPSFNLIPGHEHMKLVSQEFYVLENHTVEENIFDKLIGYPNEAKQKRAARLLKLLELQHIKNTRAKYLSSGQKQRVAIARALAVMPKVLLLDEPFSNLDKMLAEKLFSFIINEVKKQRTAVILITHVAEEALKYADRLAIVDNGKIVRQGDKWDVYYRPGNSRLAGLLGDYNNIRREDINKRFKFTQSKFFARPDKIHLTRSGDGDLQLLIIGCTYNGKCYEVLGETNSGHAVMVYAGAPLACDKSFYFNIER